MARILTAPFRPEDVPGDWDALVLGVARDATDGWPVALLHLEHHPDLAQAAADGIEREARVRFGVADTFLAHRVGAVRPGEAIVACAARAVDRAAAQAAARWMLEATKHHLPIWKREEGPRGRRWLAGHPLELIETTPLIATPQETPHA